MQHKKRATKESVALFVITYLSCYTLQHILQQEEMRETERRKSENEANCCTVSVLPNKERLQMACRAV